MNTIIAKSKQVTAAGTCPSWIELTLWNDRELATHLVYTREDNTECRVYGHYFTKKENGDHLSAAYTDYCNRVASL